MTQMNDFAYDSEDRDVRLSEALGLLQSQDHRSRHGLLSLAAITGLAVSATLLATLVSGHTEPKKPLKMEVMPAAGAADFELSAAPLQADAHAVAPREAVLIATER